MPEIRLQIIDAFTDRPLTGNSAGVVLEAAGLEESRMQAVAREVRSSETAFVCGGGGGEPFRVRFFTPAAEVPLCGHATVACFHALAWDGRIPLMDGEVVVHQVTGAGRLPLRLKVEGGRLEWVLMGQNPPQVDPYREEVGELAAPLGVPREALERADRELGPPARVSTGLPCLHVAVPDRETLRAAAPDFRALKDLSGRLGLVTVQLVTLDSGDPRAWARVRTFAPAVGVDEDPVTGTAAGSLGGWLAYVNRLPGEGEKRRFRLLQGEEMSRPGQVEVELQLAGHSVVETWVGGKAVRSLDGMISF
jgi:trans-2,3-dihydro-3-hydroxyanthranilate isomerase